MITELEFWQKVKDETWKRIKLFLRLQNPNNQLPQFAESLKNKWVDYEAYKKEVAFMNMEISSKEQFEKECLNKFNPYPNKTIVFITPYQRYAELFVKVDLNDNPKNPKYKYATRDSDLRGLRDCIFVVLNYDFSVISRVDNNRYGEMRDVLDRVKDRKGCKCLTQEEYIKEINNVK